MELNVSVDGGSPDLLRALRTCLADEPALRGRTRLVSAPMEPGRLGAGFEAIALDLAAVALPVFAGVLVTWIRQRSGRIAVRVTGPNGTRLEVTAERLAGLDAAALHKVATEMVATLTQEAQPATPRQLR